MKKILFVLLILISFNVYSVEQSCEQLTINASQEQLAEKGCCSDRGGICGCKGGRAVCCDGSLNPRCGCPKKGLEEIKNLEGNQPTT